MIVNFHVFPFVIVFVHAPSLGNSWYLHRDCSLFSHFSRHNDMCRILCEIRYWPVGLNSYELFSLVAFCVLMYRLLFELEGCSCTGLDTQWHCAGHDCTRSKK